MKRQQQQSRFKMDFKRCKAAAFLADYSNETEPPEAEPSALEKQWSQRGSFFSWLIQETPFSHQVGAKNLRTMTPSVSYFWKMTITQENAWAKFSITAIYSQLCNSTKRQIKHARYFANTCFKTALQDIIAVVAFLVQSNYTVFTSIAFYHMNSCHSRTHTPARRSDTKWYLPRGYT